MADKTVDFHLISTKLNRPRIASSVVARPQLVEQLGAPSHPPLVLVLAPAGYGKTTLVASWIRDSAKPHAWLSLDEHDNDLPVFLAYMTAAICGLFPHACTGTLELLGALALPMLPAVAATLLNDLQEIDERFVLVLDDYHAIREPMIHELIEHLLRYPPDCLQLAIISRRDPPLPLSRYRAKGQMVEIRGQQLRFTDDEAATLARNMLDGEIAPEIIAQLGSRTEGWITGLRLAILALLQEETPTDTQLGEPVTDRYAMEYLMSEVFAQQPAATQVFLLKTSVLDRLSPALCAAVTGSADPAEARSFLDAAWQANLFIVSLGRQNEWFRYHQLLRQFLKDEAAHRFSPDELLELHARAARWFAQEERLEEAVPHFLQADDAAGATRLLLQHRHTLMQRGHWSRLRRLLNLLPRPVIEREPALLLQEAWLMRIQWQAASMEVKLDAAEALLPAWTSVGMDDTSMRSLWGEVDALRATLSLQTGAAADAITRLTRALDIIDSTYQYARGYTEMLLANALQMNGDAPAALALLNHELRQSADKPQLQLRAWSALALIYYLEADMNSLWQAGTRFSEISDGHGEADGMHWGQYRLGVYHYFRNELDAAAQFFAACSDRPRYVHTMTTTNTAIGLALTYQAQGKTDAAWEIAEENVRILNEMGHTTLVPLAKAFRAELAAKQGRMAEARRWIPTAGTITLDQEYVGFYAPQLALPKILLLENEPNAWESVADCLAKLRRALELRHNRRFLLEVLALQALLHAKQGNPAAARTALTEAVALAAPGNVLRPLVDIGAELQPIIGAIAKETPHPAFVAELLSLLDATQSIQSVNPQTQAATAQQNASVMAPDALTNREIDVLLLLAKRLTNKEIAQALGVSTETVKRHASNLFQKLDVDNRRQAVAKADALGVLPHDNNR